MIRKDYNTMILNRIEEQFNRVLPLGSIVSWASSLAIYLSPIDNRFALYDALIGMLFILLCIFKNRLTAELKISITILIPIVIGVLSFMDGGFDSAAIQLIMLSNVVAVLFLSRQKSAVVAVVSIGVFIWLYYYSHGHPVDIPVKSGVALWFIQFIVFVFYLAVLHTVVYSIRGYLLESIEELQDSMERVFKLAYYDQLTGIPNHFYLDKMLLERRQQYKRGYLMIANIKNLNVINSVYGEDAGDEVLKEIARIFEMEVQKDELLSRISGNEFALWFFAPDDEGLLRRLDALRMLLDTEFYLPRVSNKIEFNIGFKSHDGTCTLEETLHHAKLALTYAKTTDTVSVVSYDATMEENLKKDSFLRKRLDDALEDDVFEVYYQTKVDTLTGKVISVEALSRWNDTALGSISPNEFVPMLEGMNRADKFGEIVLRRVLNEYGRLCDKYGSHISVSVNISPSHLISAGFVDFVHGAVAASGVTPHKIIFEITEAVMIENFDQVLSIFHTLRDIGIKISLDDFGSGYSSLNYLAKLEIDELKIDKSFVDQIEINSRIDSMLDAIMRLASDYKLNVVAEGVETKLQYDKLLEVGCNEIQGYYFSKPEPL